MTRIKLGPFGYATLRPRFRRHSAATEHRLHNDLAAAEARVVAAEVKLAEETRVLQFALEIARGDLEAANAELHQSRDLAAAISEEILSPEPSWERVRIAYDRYINPPDEKAEA